VSGLGRELVKTSAFFLQSWRVTTRNALTVFEQRHERQWHVAVVRAG
jgi:hypothetical protein